MSILGGAATAAAAAEAAKAGKRWGDWFRDRWAGRESRRQRGAPTADESLDEAAAQRYAKDAKIQTGLEMVFLNSIKTMGQDEIDDVRAFKDRHLSGGRGVKVGGRPSGGNQSDMILADHMEINNPGIGGPLMAVLGAAGIGVGSFFAMDHLKKSDAVPAANPPAVASPAPTVPAVPTVQSPNVKVDDLTLRVKWRIDPATGKIISTVTEEPPK